MPRSHPPTLLTLARAALGRGGLAPRGSSVLVAVSGGPDSMALLDVLARLRGPMGFDVTAHGVDHGLRAEAAAELDLAEGLARSHGVPFGRTRVTLEPGGNLQARARHARYAALARVAACARARLVATAHHADDRAETVLLRLLRGAGPAGLAVLPPRAPFPDRGESGLELVRPFLRARRADIEAHLARHSVPFAVDPSNGDPRYLRTRVRHELLPLLVTLSPGIVDHLCALADALGEKSGPDPGAAGLPRRTLLALAELARTQNPRARVRLPAAAFGGLSVEVGLVERAAKAHLGGKARN